jgi:protein associated with RNAse G/E
VSQLADTNRVEKRKWDGRLSSVGPARIVAAPGEAVAWYVVAGSQRTLPSKRSTEIVARHELWVAMPGEWWVLCGEGTASGEIESYVLHAAAPFERPTADVISWIDLDLDFEVIGDVVALEDEAQFHAHARSMSYPDQVVRGAWSGISSVAPRYTTGEWPFDGWLGTALAAAVMVGTDD